MKICQRQENANISPEGEHNDEKGWASGWFIHQASFFFVHNTYESQAGGGLADPKVDIYYFSLAQGLEVCIFLLTQGKNVVDYYNNS